MKRGKDEEDGEDDGFESELEEYDEGLSPEDMINEDFECELAKIGMQSFLYICIIALLM